MVNTIPQLGSEGLQQAVFPPLPTRPIVPSDGTDLAPRTGVSWSIARREKEG
jgi:hypothetical protein